MTAGVEEGPVAAEGTEEDRPFPLSRGQQALFFLHQLVPDTSAYHCIACTRITTPVDVAAFQNAVRALVRRHAMLRATFTSSGGTPEQRTRPDLASGFELVDASSWSELQVEEALKERMQRPFDLERGPLHRFCLLRRAEDSLLLLVVNHLVYDGFSSAVVLSDLHMLYACERDGGQPPARNGIEYRDFVRWQEEFLGSEEGLRQFEYWRAKLGGTLPVLDLPVDHPRGTTRFQGSSVPLRFGPARNRALHDLARSRGVTLNMLLMAAFQVLLQRYSGQDEILVGAPAFGRTRPEFLDVVGYFINPIVFRVELGGNPRFTDVLGRVRQEVIESLEHQDYPFPLLVERLSPQRDTTRNPVFQVMIDWQKREWLGDMVESRDDAGEVRLRFNMGELVLEDLNIPQQEGLFDLTLDVRELGKSLHGELKYDASLFDRATVERMEANLQTLLDGILEDPGCCIRELPVVSAEERRLLLERNRPRADFPLQRCWHEVFSEVAAARHDSPAATFGDETITYRELNRRANRLARHLRGLGAGPDVLVGLCVERSLDMLVALLAIHKSGAAYVPLDPSFPRARIALILEDAEALMVITTEPLRARLPEQRPRLVLLDADSGVIAANDDEELEPVGGPHDLAYVIFTSGSTGRPKGVEIEHRALMNLLSSMKERPGFDSSDVLVAVTTISFDIAGLELFLPLLAGGRVVIASERESLDGRMLSELTIRSGATVLQATPATWRLLLEAGWRAPGITALCGGEALPRELAERLLPRCAALWNMYGPTETTIWSLVERLSPGTGPVPIGAPIGNTEVHVLDAYLQPVPIGVPGRIHLGGAGLARGYRKRPDLTAKAFVPHPFSSDPAARLYDTGDRARFRADGSLEFLGRVDHQVKLNGFRIETGEIECVLAQHAAVRETVVVARTDKRGDMRLVAYVVGDRDRAASTVEVRELLRERLPAYMIPPDIVWLDGLPRTPNGKIDRAALPDPDAVRAESRPEPALEPPSATEEILIRAFRDVLEVDGIGVFDDFFDLGGNSLLSLKVVDRLEQETGIRLNPAEFVHQTVRQIAARLDARLAGAPQDSGRGLGSLLRRMLAGRRSR